jgi:ABC-type transport system substrate-binding protein
MARMKSVVLAGAVAAGVLAVAACSSGGASTGPGTGATASSSPSTVSLPSWASALGSSVTVTAPQTVSPGNGTPGAVVTGLIRAFNSGKFSQSCGYDEPKGQAQCKAEAAEITASDIPTIKNFALGYVAVDGSQAVVGITGTICEPTSGSKCSTNTDAAAVFSSTKTFSDLWKNSLKDTSSYSLTPCVKVGGKWYIYSTS